MTDNKDDKTFSVAGKKTLTLKPSGVTQGTVRQDMGRGRTKAVVVETKKTRGLTRHKDERPITPVSAAPVARPAEPRPVQPHPSGRPAPQPQPHQPRAEQNRPRIGVVLNDLSAGEMEARRRALADAQVRDAEEAKRRAEEEARRRVEEEARIAREKEEAVRRAAEEATRPAVEVEKAEAAVEAERPVVAE
ncbi:translation initiation factor IF-2 associated domain-containing protein, partial [Sinorhizobium fredii]